MENENTALLDGIYKASSIGIEATKMIFPKVQDRPLRRQIAQQYFDYQTTSSKVKSLMHYNGKRPKENNKFKKSMLRESIRFNTMMNKTPGHIAELMVGGTAMGIVQVTKNLNNYDGADIKVKKIAEDFLVNEQKNIDKLKKHL